MGIAPKKKKILFILEATLGGTRKCVIDLLNGLDADRFDLVFAYSNERGDDRFENDLQQIKAEGRVKLVEIPMVRAIAPAQDFQAFYQLWRLIRRIKPDLVHCHSSKAGFLGRFASKLAKPLVPTVYTPNSMAFNIHPIYKYLEKIAAPFTNVLIAAADSEKEEILNEKILSHRKIVTIPLGISIPNTKRSPKLRQELGLPDDIKLVITVGRCTHQKDPFTFLAAAKILLQKGHPLHFVWIGDGDLAPEFLRFLHANALDRFVTYLPNRLDVQELLSGADIFALSSLYESFGYVTSEAMAWGLPIVATNVIGTKSLVVNEVTGILVPPTDPQSLADKICYLLENPILAKQYGEAGRERARIHFSVQRMCQDTARLYEGLVSRPGMIFSEAALEN